MLKVLLPLLAVCLPHAVFCSPSVSYNWPCPPSEDIVPCTCHTNADFDLIMNCTDVVDNHELRQVFQAHFPLTDFKTLIITPFTPSTRLDTLGTGVFGLVSFEIIIIFNTKIATIESGALDNSFRTLSVLEVAFNSISSFPFEDLSSFTNLNYLNVEDNQLTAMSDIVSNSLKFISLSRNRGLTITSSAFAMAPALEGVFLHDLHLSHFPAGVFSGMADIRVISLSNNRFSGELKSNFVNPPDDTLLDLQLHNNTISSIKRDSITGLQSSAKVNLRFNSIEFLDQNEWEPFLNQVTSDDAIDLRGNILTCGCDVFWLVVDRVSMNKIHKGTKCISGERLHDLPQSIFIDHCPM